MEDFSKYKTLFDYVKENNVSGYHYDKNIDDSNDPLLVVKKKFSGDWHHELQNFNVKQTISYNLENPYTRLQWQHWLSLNYDPNKFSDKCAVDISKHPKISKIVDSIALEKKQVWLTRQKPGCYVPYHHDVLSSAEGIDLNESRERGVRILVHLNDWTPGEFMIWGTRNLMNWKAGDIVAWPAVRFPHATANASFQYGYRLRISGLKTQEFEEFLKSDDVIKILD